MTRIVSSAHRLAILCAGLLSANDAVAADKIEEWAAMLPESASIVISIRDTQEFFEDWDASGLGRFLHDEAVKRWMAPLHVDGEAAWDKSFKEMTGSTFAENMAVYSGGTVAGVVISGPEDFENDGSRFVSFGDVTGKEAELEAVKAKQLEAHRKEEHPDAVLSSKEVDGVTVKFIAESGEEDAEWIEAWAVVDGVAVEASDEELMEEMLGRLKGEGGDENPAADHLARLTEIRGSAPDLSVLVDLDAMIGMLKEYLEAKQAASPATPFSPVQMITAFGLDELHAAVLCLDITETHSRGEVVLMHDEKPEGFLPALIRGTGTEVPRPAFMPADVDAGSVSRQSVGAMYDALFKAVGKMGPMAGMITMQLQAMEQKAGMSLRNDLLGTLDDVLVEVQNIAPGVAGIQPVTTQVTGFKLKNRERFMAAFDALVKMIGNGFGVFEESEFEGHKIFTMKPSLSGAPQGGGQQSAQATFSYVITEEYLFLAQGAPDLLHKVLVRLKNPSGPSLWEQPRAQAALAALPPGYTGMGVSNGSSIIRTMLTTMSRAQSVVPGAKGGAKPGAGKGPKGPKAKPEKTDDQPAAPVGAAGWFDPEATPPDEVFDRYFGMGATGFYSHPGETQILYISLPAEKQP